MSSVDIQVPDLPESVANATVSTWYKKLGDHVQRDEVLVDIETDKVILEVPSPITGVLEALLEEEGSIVVARQVLGRLLSVDKLGQAFIEKSNSQRIMSDESFTVGLESKRYTLSPAIRRRIAEHNLKLEDIKGSCMDARITREDVEKHLAEKKIVSVPEMGIQRETRVPMTRLRKRIAERLLEAKNSTAMLTTFNEANMKPVMDLRQKYGADFEKRHGVRLGFMSFFIKAVLDALKLFPEINASIDGEDVVYHNYFDVSVAVSTPRGLVTPVIKNIDVLGMSDIEKTIKELAIKGRDGKLKVEELIGGNFTVTNGGVFGSLMSTPIINPPQSAILGIHTIKDRPMEVNGEVVILPMMYLALSYDHRLIDGKESVHFLIRVKEILESPIRLLLDV